MGNISKIIRLLKLFYTRNLVTIDEIINLCDINRRTAFRYLNEMSEANIPLYYDNNLMGYKIRDFGSKFNTNMSLSEVALIVFSLKNISSEINQNYETDFEKALNELLITNENAEFNIDKVSEIYENDKIDTEETSVQLTNFLVNLAIDYNRSLKIFIGEELSIKIKEPRLIFEKEWNITESKIEKQKLFKIKNIQKIQII